MYNYMYVLFTHIYTFSVVVWCHLLGGIQYRQDPVSYSRCPDYSKVHRRWIKIGKTKQCSLFSRSVSRLEPKTILAILIFNNCRFSVVIKCWTLNPKNRPTFAALCSSFEKLLKAVAGYQELEMQLLPEDDNIT